MTIPKAEFTAWVDWARTLFSGASSYPLIDEKVHNFDLLWRAYHEYSHNDATREYLESQLAQSPSDIALRFVILNYYYELAHFDSDRKEEDVAHLREQFRRNLGFFVRLRPFEECTDAVDINWEIINACVVRDWTRVRLLFMRLRSTETVQLGKFHAAYGHCLFRAAFDNYDPEDPADDSERLSQWSVSIVERSGAYIDDLFFGLVGEICG
jgi:hypothetical protein